MNNASKSENVTPVHDENPSPTQHDHETYDNPKQISPIVATSESVVKESRQGESFNQEKQFGGKEQIILDLNAQQPLSYAGATKGGDSNVSDNTRSKSL